MSIEDRIKKQISSVGPELQSIAKRLRPIYEHLLHDDVEEVAVNRPGEIWRRMRRQDAQGRLWVPHSDPRLTKSYLTTICHQLANVKSIKNFGPNGMPVFYTTIPGGHRFGAGLGYNIQFGTPDQEDPAGSICFCARQYLPSNPIKLDDYGIRPTEMVRPTLRSMFTKDTDPNDDYVKIVNSLTRGDHILLSGETGSGKTTFLNWLVENLDPTKRILTLEDTRELRVLQPNRVHIVMSRTGQSNMLTYPAVRDLVVRMTPDIVLAGEISQSNAATIYELMTTGHGHFMTTIHAKDPEQAITTFMNCISNARAAGGNADGMDRDEVRKTLESSLRIIQFERDKSTGLRHATKII